MWVVWWIRQVVLLFGRRLFGPCGPWRGVRTTSDLVSRVSRGRARDPLPTHCTHQESSSTTPRVSFRTVHSDDTSRTFLSLRQGPSALLISPSESESLASRTDLRWPGWTTKSLGEGGVTRGWKDGSAPGWKGEESRLHPVQLLPVLEEEKKLQP